MSGVVRCRHCGEPIRPSYSDYTGWTHEDSNANGRVYCRITMATPEED